jgi:hypothetical protein
VALTGVLVVGGALPAGAAVTPILECSYRDPGTGQYNTVWGYTNDGSATVKINAGNSKNRFDNPGSRVGQPDDFLPGTQHNVFIVTHSGNSTWTLDAGTATAPGKACSTNPVPIVSEGLGGLVALVVVTVVMGLVVFVRFRPRRA